MLKLNKIKNVYKFKLFDDNLIYITKNDEIKWKNKSLKIEDAGEIFFTFDGLLIVEDNYGKAFFIDKKYPNNLFLNHEFSLEKVFNEYAIIYKHSDNEEISAVYNFKVKKILFVVEHLETAYIFSNKLVHTWNDNIIYLKDVDTGKSLWQYSIAHFPNYINGFGDEVPADIEQIIGIYNNLLWVILGAKTLIALNIKTGTLEHTFEKFKKGMGDIHLDEQKGVLKILAGFSYEEFDLKTLTTTEKYKDKDEKLFIRSCNFYPGDDNLYFCAVNNWPDNTSFNAFGVFNTIQNRVIWLQEQQDDWGLFYNPPQANQKQLAILDDKGNLLIFEKEDIIGKASLSNT